MSRAYGHRGPANSGPAAAYRYDRAMISKRPHRVAVLALPAVIPLELGIASEIFGRDPHYRLTVCAEGRSASLPGSGLTVNTPAGLEGLKRAETVIIPGYEDVDATVSTAVLDAIRAAHARGARLVSICTAAFALAAAGVLDDRPATTHWRWTAELQGRYPRIDVLPNRLFVDDGDVLTSAGVTTGIDLSSTSSGATLAPQPPTHKPGASWLRHSVKEGKRSSSNGSCHSRAATNSVPFGIGCSRTLPFP